MKTTLACCLLLLPAVSPAAQGAGPVTSVRRLTEQPGHAIAFDQEGALYFGRGKTVSRLVPGGTPEPFATLLPDTGDTPHLWSLTLGPDGQLYGAAHDRVVRISAAGQVTTVVEEDYPGPCGATDVDFDAQGNMLVAYADKLARYSPGGKKTIVLDGARIEPPLAWIVGVRVDRRSGDVWLSDVRTRRVLRCRFAPDGTLVPARVLELPEHPEYFAIADDGRVYVGFPDGNAVARLDTDTPPALDRLAEVDFVASLSFGGRGFDAGALYAACRNGIFEIRLAPKTAVRDGFVAVRGGSFQMGDLWGDGPWAMQEAPPREVQVDDFLLAAHELSVAEFGRFVDATGYRTVAEVDGPEHFRRMQRKNPGFRDTGRYHRWREHGFQQGPDHPVVMLAWEDAIAYCNWRSRQEGLPPAYDERTGRLLRADGEPTTEIREVKGYRLPTEAEWEFAARERGRKVRFGNGQDVARSSEMNFDAAGTGEMVPSLRLPKHDLHPYNEPGVHRKGTTPVGSFAPNALGLYDMSGNAWEWCTDTGGPAYPTAATVNPCAQDGTTHVLRGGMHDTDAKACRASARIDWGGRSFCPGSGFRLALTVDGL